MGNMSYIHCLYVYSIMYYIIMYVLFFQVARHLAKLFDSMAKLKFKEDADGQPTKEAVGMYSKDGEYVDFDESCKCVGQV